MRALDPDGNGAVGRLELSSGLALLGLPLGGTEADELFDALNGEDMMSVDFLLIRREF